MTSSERVSIETSNDKESKIYTLEQTIAFYGAQKILLLLFKMKTAMRMRKKRSTEERSGEQKIEAVGLHTTVCMFA